MAPPQLPHDLAAEVAVLGGLLLAPEEWTEVADILVPDSFYELRHQRIWAAMVAVVLAGEPLGTMTVLAAWRQASASADLTYLPQLFESVVPHTDLRHQAERLAALARAREGIAAARRYAQALYQAPTDLAAWDTLESELAKLREQGERRGPRPVHAVEREEIAALKARSGDDAKIPGLPTGLTDLDTLTNGLQPGDLIVVAGRPSQGKSALVLGILHRIASHEERPCLLFTLEDSLSNIYGRLVCSTARVPADHWRRIRGVAAHEWAKVGDAITALHSSVLWVDDDSALTVAEIAGRTRRFRRKHPDLAALAVDYLQIVAPDPTAKQRGQTQERRVGETCTAFKRLAKELQVPLLLVSQLNRQTEREQPRGGGRKTAKDPEGAAPKAKRPTLSDLRDSGQVEQDADVVLLVHREDWYRAQRGESIRDNVAEILVPKQRNGASGIVRVRFDAESVRFEDLSRRGDWG